MRSITTLLLLSLTLSLGCTSTPRRGRGGVDTGPRPTSDGSTTRDTGTITLMDSGTPRDTSVAPRDTGTTVVDSGTGTCAEDLVPPYSGTACSSATSSCTAACTDGACINSCLDADSSADCSGCANQNIISCFNSNGCQAEWNCFIQCAHTFACADAPVPRDCITTHCPSQDDAYNNCTAAITTGDCGTTWTTCIP